jgi:nitrate/nitrite-specific signal transduction histidine kinase
MQTNESDSANGKGRRKIKNMFLAPKSQATTGGIIAIFGFVAITAIFSVILFRFSEMIDVLVAMASDSELAEQAAQNTKLTIWMTYATLIVGFIAFAMFMSVKLTHRYLGPMVAIRRHLDAVVEGQYDDRIQLREDDEFMDIAEKINVLTERLEGLSPNPK